ncbi:hypothetical protein Ct9H90mP29_19850 [bacterium]|nr:MAG: hypothetical protein Ct9H90mP29_19850 [bacterium]
MGKNFLTYSSTFGSEDINEGGYSITQRTDSSFIILGGMDNDILLLGTDRYGNASGINLLEAANLTRPTTSNKPQTGAISYQGQHDPMVLVEVIFG